MLLFVVPLQSPEASADWTRVCALCNRTVRSICAQTSNAFHVFLVCNRRPGELPAHPALTVIEEPFPIPAADHASRMRDKSAKLQRAYVAARPFLPGHVMLVDADDCVSNRLAGIVNEHAASPGWYFDDGYIHDEGSNWLLRRRHHFHLLCGTSHILRCEPEDLPANVHSPEEALWITSRGHAELARFMAGRGTPLRPLPFPGAIYNLATGENCSHASIRSWRSKRMMLSKLLNFRPLTAAIRREFSLTDLSRIAPAAHAVESLNVFPGAAG
jgi:hypothetical protein